MLDVTPEPRPAADEPKESLVGIGIPRLELRAIGGVFNIAVMTPYRLLRVVEQTIRQQLAVRGLANKPPRYFDAPTTRFNASVTCVTARQRCPGAVQACQGGSKTPSK